MKAFHATCRLSFVLALSVSTAPTQAHAQATPPTIEQIQASYNAHKDEFDYLLGDWEFTGRNPNGLIRGRWSAVKPVRQATCGENLDGHT